MRTTAHLPTLALAFALSLATTLICVAQAPGIASDYTFEPPPIYNTRSIRVFDDNNDGVIDGGDIQNAIDIAAADFSRSGHVYTVQLDTPQDVYVVRETLVIPSGVIIDGRGRRLVASQQFDDPHFIRIAKNSVLAGIKNTNVYTNYQAKSSCISVGQNAKSILISNNKFLDETTDGSGRVRQEGNAGHVSMIEIIESGAKNIYILDNVFLHMATGVTIGYRAVSNIMIYNNAFSKWRVRAIYVVGADEGTVHHISILKNRINPPKNGGIRQPIAIQAPLNSEGFTSNVLINYNSIYNDALPHIWEYRFGSDGELFRYTNFNTASADAISLHQCKDFQVMSNAIINSGEAGIVVARKSRDGLVGLNFIYGIDTIAVAVGSAPQFAEDRVRNVAVNSNLIVNSGANRDNSLPAWARSGIGFINSTNSTASNNTIVEANTRYGANGNSNSLQYAFFEYNAGNVSYGPSNILVAPNHVQRSGSR